LRNTRDDLQADLKSRNNECKVLQVKLAEAEKDANKWSEVPLMSRKMTRGHPFSASMVKLCLGCIATGASARNARDVIIMPSSKHFFPNENFDVPSEGWFPKIRESLGIEADLYTYMKIAAAHEILQLGFDETTEINGESTSTFGYRSSTMISTKLVL
jgi:hypothetical protein